MILNGIELYAARPLEPMSSSKVKGAPGGTSYGLSEAGYDVRIKQSITLSPRQRFALASTVERFEMPRNLVGVVHDKSTWARRGLSVFNTVIEPGWAGWLTLELVYHGDGELLVPAGAGVAQVLFTRLTAPADYAGGKYHLQPDYPVPARER